MKVFIFMPSLAGGGAERTVVNICNRLAEKGWFITLALGKELDDELRSSKYVYDLNGRINLKYLKVEAKAKNFLKIIFEIRAIVKEINPDIFFTTRLPSNIIAIFSVMFLSNVKLVVRESVYRSSTIKSFFYRRIIGFLYNRADIIVSLSKGVRQDLVDNFHVNEDKIKLIYNPIHIESIKELSLKKNTNHRKGLKLIFVGRFDVQKSPIDAVKAFILIKEKNPNAVLDMYGIGPLMNEAIDFIESVKAVGVTVHGFTDNPYAKFSESDFFLMPSKYEGFGHVIVESLVCGCLPIVYDCPHGPAEILTGRLEKLLVPVGEVEQIANKVQYFIENPIEIKDLLDLGCNRVIDFDSTIIVNEYAYLFESLIEGNLSK